jgi:hypothetical protein
MTEDMWITQLDEDKDVIAQFEAIKSLSSNFSQSEKALVKMDHVLKY